MGSIERFFGILIEHYGGAFPTWLAPVQAIVMAITDNQREFVAKVVAEMKAAGFRVEADLRNEKIGLKIREAEKAKTPFMFIVGEREVQSGSLSVRGRSGANLGSMTVAGALDLLRAEVNRAGQQLSPTSWEVAYRPQTAREPRNSSAWSSSDRSRRRATRYSPDTGCVSTGPGERLWSRRGRAHVGSSRLPHHGLREV